MLLGETDSFAIEDGTVAEIFSELNTGIDMVNSKLENIHADFKVAFIGTNTNTEMVIKMNKSEGTALLFGRTAGNKPIGAIITHDNAANLGTGGTYAVNDGVITCSLGAYAAGYLLYNRSCIESISYS